MGYDFISGLQITVSPIHRQKHLGLGPFRLRIFPPKWGIEPAPMAMISVSSAMKGEPGLATLCYTLSFVRGNPVTETCVKQGSNRGQGFLRLYRGSSPFTHCATSASNCATSAGKIKILQ